MGPLAVGGQAASTLFNFVGAMRQASGVRSMAASKERYAAEQRAAAEFEAQQHETNAIQSVAVAQRAMLEEQRQATLAASRILAVAGASGAGTGGTVEHLIGKTASTGAYRAALALWKGKDAARQARNRAAAVRYTGEARGRLAMDEAGALSSQAGMMRFGAATSLLGDVARGGASLIKSGVIKI